jgi:hypothetical protein
VLLVVLVVVRPQLAQVQRQGLLGKVMQVGLVEVPQVQGVVAQAQWGQLLR